MALRSLIVKIGADTQALDKALASVGASSKNMADGLKKLGDTPLGQQAQKDAERLQQTIEAVFTSTKRLATQSQDAGAGIAAIGGPAKLTTGQLQQMNRTLQDGLSAFKALGQEAPAQLQKVAAEVQKQAKAISGSGGLFGALNSAVSALPGGNLLAGLSGGGALALGGAVTAVTGALVTGARAAFTYADSLVKLSDQTSINVEALQRLEGIALPSGNSLDQVANAVSKFQKNIATGSAETVSTISELGLSIQQLQQLTPDQQFIAIAHAIQTITDPAEQARVAIALFGKSGAEILPTLKANVDSLAKATHVMSEDMVKALDDAGDAWQKFKRDSVTVAGEVAASFILANKEFTQQIKELDRARQLTQGKLSTDIGLPPSPKINAPLGSTRFGTDIAAFTGSTQALAAAVAATDAAVGSLNAQTKKAAEGVDALAEAQRKLLESAKSDLFGTELIARATLYSKALGDIDNISKLTATSQDALLKTVKDAAGVYQAEGQAVPASLQRVIDALDAENSARNIEAQSLRSNLPLIAGNAKAYEELTNRIKGLTSEGLIPMVKGFDDLSRASLALADHAQHDAAVLKALFQGVSLPGGGPSSLTTALKAELDNANGAKAWEKSLKDVSHALADLATVAGPTFSTQARELATVVSGAAAAVQAFEAMKVAVTNLERASVILTALSIALQIFQLIKSLGGASQEELAGRSAEGDFEKQLAGSLTAAQRLQAGTSQLSQAIVGLRQRYIDAGVAAADADKQANADIASLLAAEKQGAGAVQRVIDTINARIEAQKDAQQAVASGVDKVVSAFQAAGTKIPDSLKQSLNDLAHMKGLTDDERIALQKLADGTKPSFDDLSNAATGLGLDLSKLGPTLSQQDLDHKAEDIFGKFTLLQDAGADFNALLAGTAGKFNDIVKESQQTGTKVPENLRPILEQMARNGLLTDQFGNKLTDVSTISFEDTPIAESISNLVKAIQDLIDTLNNKLAPAITGLPDHTVTITTKYKTDGAPADPRPQGKYGLNLDGTPDNDGDPTNSLFTGGIVTAFGVQQFAIGGRVLPFIPRFRGTDTVPAMLTPGEIVINAAQQGRLADALTNGSGGGSVSYDFRGAMVFDGPSLRDFLARKHIEAQRVDAAGIRGVTRRVAKGAA